MVLMSLIPGLILAVVYYRNVKDFYQDKTWTYQENTLRLMEAKMQDIVKQSEVVLNQVLGLSVTSDLFSGYTEMNAYERLNLMRNINGTLSNIRIANNSIDHIYLLAFDGGAYSSMLAGINVNMPKMTGRRFGKTSQAEVLPYQRIRPLTNT